MTGNYDDIPYPPDYGAPHAMTPTPTLAIDRDKVEMPVSFTIDMCEGTADAVQYRIDRAIERDGSIDAARTGAGMGFGFSLMTQIVGTLQNAAKDLASLRTQLSAATARGDKAEAERDMWAAVSGEWEKQMGQFRPGRVTDDALFEANRAIAKERDEFRSECVANLKDESDKPELGARDYAEQWAQDTLSGRADGNKFPWGQRNIARAFINMTTELSTYRALIEKAVEALGPILSFVEDLDASALSLTEQEMRPKFIRRARETLAALTAAIGKGEGT